MDESALFRSVLQAGEVLLWCGGPPYISGRRLAAFGIGTVMLCLPVVFLLTAPIPPHANIAVLITGILVFCAVPISMVRFAFKGDRVKAYAVTDQRLLLALGPRRTDLRAVALRDLDPVTLTRPSRSDRKLQFQPRGSTGKSIPDPLWIWYVRDPVELRELIEQARLSALARLT